MSRFSRENLEKLKNGKSPLLAQSRLFEIGEFMSVTAWIAEVISEKSENPFLMSVIRRLSGSEICDPKTSQFDP